MHMIKLRTHNELELLKNCISLNQSIAYIDDDFDAILHQLLSMNNSSDSNKNKTQYSMKLIKQASRAIEWLNKNKNQTGEEIGNHPVTMAEYLQNTSLENPNIQVDTDFY